ncbi:MAG: hypothetical protein HQK53_18885, partial [Oligoflexia bacterium]|nr:hypothetical protein [Oligoflexia bacterium]
VFSYGFVLYFLLFQALRSAGVTTLVAVAVFNVVAALLNLLFAILFLKTGSGGESPKRAFAIVGVHLLIFTFFLFVGPYHEYPSDPVQHFKFISQVGYSKNLSEIPLNFFNYFFIYLLTGKVDLLTHYYNLSIYSALVQTALFYLFYRLTFTVLPKRSLAVTAAILSLCYFGTNIFSFYRYYPFAKSFFTYFAYLESMIVLIETIKTKRIMLLSLILPMIAYCATSHLQEALFIYLQLTLVPIIMFFSLNKSSIKESRFHYKMLGISLLNIVLFALVFPYIKKFDTYYDPVFLFLLKRVFPLLPESIAITSFSFSSPFFRTAGFFGILAIIISILFLLKWKVVDEKVTALAAITAAPVLVIFCPLTVYFLGKIFPCYLLYRLLYSSFYWIILPILIYYFLSGQAFWQKTRTKLYTKKAVLFSGFLLLVLLSYKMPSLSWGGRGEHLVYRPSPESDGRSISKLIHHLGSTPKWNNTVFVSDGYTEVFLKIHGFKVSVGDRFYTNRMIGEEYFWKKSLMNDPVQIKKAIGREVGSKSVAIIINKQSKNSENGQKSGHWKKEETNSLSLYAHTFLETLFTKDLYRETEVTSLISIFN